MLFFYQDKKATLVYFLKESYKMSIAILKLSLFYDFPKGIHKNAFLSCSKKKLASHVAIILENLEST